MNLLIFKVNQLGDNVVYLPLVQQLAARFPHWRVTIMTSPAAAPLYEVACSQTNVLSHATQDFNASWKNPALLTRLLRAARASKPDTCLLGNDQGSAAHLIARLSGASLCIGPRVPERRLGFLLHHREPLIETDSAARQNWRIAQAMLTRLDQPPLPDAIPAPDLSAFGRESHHAIAIHAGASRAYKRWPLERFIALANRLADTHPVLWFDQNEAAETLLDPRIRRVTPGSLHDFIRLLAGARHFIGNNSGPMNLASALGIAGTIFNGPSRPNWDPVWHSEKFDLLRDAALACQPCDLFSHPVNQCQNTLHPMACMDRWSVNEVHQRVLSSLE